MRRTLLLASLALVLPAFSVKADDNRDLHAPTQTEMATEARVALVIGNGAHPSGPLKNPANDAKLMASRGRHPEEARRDRQAERHEPLKAPSKPVPPPTPRAPR